MDWTSFIGPTVAAAAIAALVSVALAERRLKGDFRLAERKIAADLALAERKFELDQRLAERKVDLDGALAEKKLELDRALAMWRRRYELAEQLLTVAYEARDALTWSRARVVFSGEGETRHATEGESEKLQERRNSYFVPVERLSRDAKSFATLQTLRYTVAAHFGQDAAKAVGAITEAHHEIVSTAGLLIQLASADDSPSTAQNLIPLRERLWGQRPDAMDRKIEEAVAALEAICRPVLSEKPPT